MLRMQSARHAARSLDVQTYIWHADLTGIYIAQQLLESADRGVRVRLLVDDLDARALNDGYAALAAHPNIDVRLFNPWVSRDGTLRRAGEGAELQAHQSPDAQQELDRRQPDRDRRWAQHRRRIFRRRRGNELRRSRFCDARSDREGRVRGFRQILELRQRLPGRNAGSEGGQRRSPGRTAREARRLPRGGQIGPLRDGAAARTA